MISKVTSDGFELSLVLFQYSVILPKIFLPVHIYY